MMPLGVIGLVLLGYWGIACWRKPYVICGHCQGEKRNWDEAHEHFGDIHCWWCLDEGYRYRWELRWLTVF